MCSLVHIVWLLIFFLCVSTGVQHLKASNSHLPYFFGDSAGSVKTSKPVVASGWAKVEQTIAAELALAGTASGTEQNPGASKSPGDPGPKRGVGGIFTAVDDLSALKALSWFYNWNSGVIPHLAANTKASGMEFVPMQWSAWNLKNLESRISAAAAAGVKMTALLGFNEPNHRDQADIWPQYAAALWPSLEAVANKHGLRLGAPSASGCGNPKTCITSTAEKWLDEFFMHCTGCRVDFITSHIYTCNLGVLKSTVRGLAARYKRPVWITEFNCPNHRGTLERELSFMQAALQYLDNEPVVERYAWFTVRWPRDWSISLLQSGVPNLTLTGQVYTAAAKFDITPTKTGALDRRLLLADMQSNNSSMHSSTASSPDLSHVMQLDTGSSGTVPHTSAATAPHEVLRKRGRRYRTLEALFQRTLQHRTGSKVTESTIRKLLRFEKRSTNGIYN